MPTIGLIVEGEDDVAVIPVLLKRCREGIRVVTRKCRGTVTRKCSGIVAELHRSHRLEKVLIVSDADGQKPASLKAAIKRKITARYSFAIIPLIIVEALEAWLIADPLALERVVGVKKTFARPEARRDAKKELQKLFYKRGIAYTPETLRKIAEKIDLGVLEQRCPQFATFREAVVDP